MFTKGALRAVADVGLKRGGGARGLRGVLEEVLGDAMFEVPGSVCLPHLKSVIAMLMASRSDIA